MATSRNNGVAFYLTCFACLIRRGNYSRDATTWEVPDDAKFLGILGKWPGWWLTLNSRPGASNSTSTTTPINFTLLLVTIEHGTESIRKALTAAKYGPPRYLRHETLPS